jgi:recombination protein RecA
MPMAKKKDTNVAEETRKDELAVSIVDALNKSFKDGQVAYIIGQEETPTDLIDFVSTGTSLLDLAISNRPHGGIACGRITELTGLEGSGKSLLAAHMMANVQKEGGVVVLIDTENAVNAEFFEAIGLNFGQMVYAQPDTVEDIFTMIETIITRVREKQGNEKKIIIVVDSVTAAPTEQESEADYSKDGYATGKAIIISKAMRKITQLIAKQKIALVFTNQLRQKMNAPAFSDPYTTSGGKALAFHASVRLRLAVTGKIKNKAGDVVGVTCKASVIKNRLGPPFRVAEFNIYFDRGIDDLESWLKFCKDKDIITSSGPNAVYTAMDGTEHKIVQREWKLFLTNNPSIKDEIYSRMATALIMSYSSAGLTEADLDLTDSGDIE